jgi:hypothetical protein
MTPDPLTYQTGLVVGRAFAMANGPLADPRAPEELLDLVAGDRDVLRAARERFLGFVLRDPDSMGDARALHLVEQALTLSVRTPVAV